MDTRVFQKNTFSKKQGKHSARKPPKLIILQMYKTKQNLQCSRQVSCEIQANWLAIKWMQLSIECNTLQFQETLYYQFIVIYPIVVVNYCYASYFVSIKICNINSALWLNPIGTSKHRNRDPTFYEIGTQKRPSAVKIGTQNNNLWNLRRKQR